MRFGTDGYQVFFFGQPVDGIQEQVSVAAVSKMEVGGKIRIADGNNSGQFFFFFRFERDLPR